MHQGRTASEVAIAGFRYRWNSEKSDAISEFMQCVGDMVENAAYQLPYPVIMTRQTTPNGSAHPMSVVSKGPNVAATGLPSNALPNPFCPIIFGVIRRAIQATDSVSRPSRLTPSPNAAMATHAPETIRFTTDQLELIDQTKLPTQLTYLVCETVEQTHSAIRRLVVRGAPAIGIAAAYGVCLAKSNKHGVPPTKKDYLNAIEYLATSRPTAVNLFWALDRMAEVVESTDDSQLLTALITQARKIHDEDRVMCRAIGRNGASLLSGVDTVLTHCNAGGLATSMWGTALAPIYHLHQTGKRIKVFADETRPLLQGGRLTAWELSQAGVDVTVITDSMAGALMHQGRIGAVIVGADRITAAGDVANKIGTYSVAVLAKHHRLPFYVAAPSNTFDMELVSGDEIPIEQRDRDEVACPHGTRIVPDEANVLNPAFDVTPAELVTAIITEVGVIESPTQQTIESHFADRT